MSLLLFSSLTQLIESFEGEDETTGTLLNTYTHNSFLYTSSIDPALTDLYAEYSYDNGVSNLPILVLMHGLTQNVSNFDDATLDRFAASKFFVLAVGMRGRDGASGTKDGSAREIQDIIDAVESAKTNFSSIVDPDKICIVGYSGGGGNVLAAASKFPDYFTVGVCFFSISDYGHSANGMHQLNYERSAIEAMVGGTPAALPNDYHARAHYLSIAKNFKNGYLYLFHDDQDANVPVIQSTIVEQEYDNKGNTNYEIDITTTSDDPRWLHALPNAGQPIIQAETIFLSKCLTRNPWTIPTTGQLVIMGYVVTKRFKIWLGDGTDEVADLSYNVNSDSYTITPLTGSMDVVITQGAKSASQTITGKTTIIVQ